MGFENEGILAGRAFYEGAFRQVLLYSLTCAIHFNQLSYSSCRRFQNPVRHRTIDENRLTQLSISPSPSNKPKQRLLVKGEVVKDERHASVSQEERYL
jgi:hypothetical protein